MLAGWWGRGGTPKPPRKNVTVGDAEGSGAGSWDEAEGVSDDIQDVEFEIRRISGGR